MKTARIVLGSLLLLILAAPVTFAHERRVVGDGDERYYVIFGFVQEPVFTQERNGLDLFIRRAGEDRVPVEGIEGSLNATITSPDGTQTHTFTLRARYGGSRGYTDEVMLTRTGVYKVRIWGIIGNVEFDETFHSSEVREISSLRFPRG